MSSQLVAKQDREDMAVLFKQLDVSGDGRLDKKEMGPILLQVGKNMSCEDLAKTLENMDVDGSGFVDYSEFIAAVLANEKLLTEKNLH